MSKRKELRISKSLLVDIDQNGIVQMGITVNVSRRGLCIATTEIFPAHSELCILIAAADDIYPLTGVVVWNMKSASHDRRWRSGRSGYHGRAADKGRVSRILQIYRGHEAKPADRRQKATRLLILPCLTADLPARPDGEEFDFSLQAQ